MPDRDGSALLERRHSHELTLIVDEDYHVVAMHAPPALIVDGTSATPAISPRVEQAAKELGPEGGVTVLNLAIVMRVTPLMGDRPLRAMVFEELRTRSEDTSQ